MCISDEAHRSQTNLDEQTRVTDTGVYTKYGFARYLHDSLPNATYVGFTGTPGRRHAHRVRRHRRCLHDGRVGARRLYVNLVYEGRAAKVNLDSSRVREIEDYYVECEGRGANLHQIEESKKATTTLDVILGDGDRLDAVAADFVRHYETRVAEGATARGKAMFVCANRFIAYDLYTRIIALRPEWGEVGQGDVEGLSEKEAAKVKPIERMKLIMTRGKDDPKAMYDMLGTDEDRKELARQFKDDRSNFKIAIVVDMWLTGFDVPSLDTIYIDKPIQKHSLIQAVSRVNRVFEGKARGLIVDYIGIKKYLNEAVKTYTHYKGDDFDGVEQAAKLVRDRPGDNRRHFQPIRLERLLRHRAQEASGLPESRRRVRAAQQGGRGPVHVARTRHAAGVRAVCGIRAADPRRARSHRLLHCRSRRGVQAEQGRRA